MLNRFLFSKLNNNIVKNTLISFQSVENFSSISHGCSTLIGIIDKKSTTLEPTTKKMSSIATFEPTRPLPVGMKGVQVENFGDEKELKIKDNINLLVKNVEELKPKQVLIKVISAGINPVDTYIRSGSYARLPDLPYIPGSDAAGFIEAVGSEVCSNKFHVGSRVFVTGPGKNSGSYADYVISDQCYVFPLDERLSFSQGACLGVPYFTAYKALILGGEAKKDETVLVHGASGAVGSAAVQIAKSVGAKVFGTAGTEEGMEVVTKSGAHHTFNHREDGYETKMKEQTNGEGFDVIIENLANVNLEKDLQMMKKNARIMIVGSRGPITINPRHLMAPEASIKGVALGSTTDEQYEQIGTAISNGIISGWVNPVIDKEYSMDETPTAHYDIINSKGAKGNLVLKIVSI